MKVFCENCKYHQGGWMEQYCQHKPSRKFCEGPIGQFYIYSKALLKNLNNNCEDYKEGWTQKLWNRIRTGKHP